jgi:hypothetical protein
MFGLGLSSLELHAMPKPRFSFPELTPGGRHSMLTLEFGHEQSHCHTEPRITVTSHVCSGRWPGGYFKFRGLGTQLGRWLSCIPEYKTVPQGL